MSDILSFFALILSILSFLYTRRLFKKDKYPELEIKNLQLARGYPLIQGNIINVTNTIAVNTVIHMFIIIKKKKYEYVGNEKNIFKDNDSYFKTDLFLCDALVESNLYEKIQRKSSLEDSIELKSLNITNAKLVLDIHLKYKPPLRNSKNLHLFKKYKLELIDSTGNNNKLLNSIRFNEKRSLYLDIKNFIYNLFS